VYIHRDLGSGIIIQEAQCKCRMLDWLSHEGSLIFLSNYSSSLCDGSISTTRIKKWLFYSAKPGTVFVIVIGSTYLFRNFLLAHFPIP
jgi:hypothetical protein